MAIDFTIQDTAPLDFNVQGSTSLDFDVQSAGGLSPVLSVNGKVGHVMLDAEDVGALPDTTSIPSKTSDLTNDSGFITSSYHDSTKADVSTTYTKTEVDIALAGKQATLESGTNIKTVNSQSILGSGNIEILGSVTSVNGQTGVVVLDAEDVGALPTGYHDSTKQDTINDLATIRSGASAGATAVQPSTLNAYRTSAAQDLIDAGKQAKLTAGTHISLTNNTVSTDTNSVAVSQTGTSTTDVQYITVDGTEYRLAGRSQGEVTSVNGKTGVVVLDATDVGALPDSTVIPSKTSDIINDSGYITNSVSNLTNYRSSSAQDVIDNAMASDITAIEGKIPNEATSSNQLADKNFVNSSISTNTATFRGTSATGLTEEQFIAWANTLTKTNNDYVFWNTTDEHGNVVYKRYKYNGSVWVYEYTLNNSSFTSVQWSTINSGLSASDKTKIDGIESGAEVNVLEGVSINGSELAVTDKKVNIPIASNSNLGVIIGNTSYAFGINSTTGIPNATTKTLSAYGSLAAGGFIGKGTLENIKSDLTKRALTDQFQTAYTDTEKLNARNTIGALGNSDLAPYRTSADQDIIDATKVDKVTGKGLSTEDYTTEDKTKLAGVEAGAEVNVQPDWNETDSTKDDYIKNKPTIPTVPTNISAFTNDVGYLTSHQSLANYDTKSEVNTKISNATNDMATQTWVGQQGYLTQHQDISGKENISNKVTSVTSSSTNNEYPSAKAVYDGLATKQDTIPSNTYDTYGSASAVQSNLNTHTGDSTIHVTSSDKSTWSGKYSKPSSGIPASDIASGVIPTELADLGDDTTHRVVTDTQISSWNGKASMADVNAKQDIITSNTDLTAKTINAGLVYTTTTPTAANTNGFKVAVLSSEPATKYSGWLYIITE